MLLKVTDTCASYCRHCFRRATSGGGEGFIGMEIVRRAASYVGGHPGVREVLLSGGDPLVLDDPLLDEVLGAFRSDGAGPVLRLCTRAPAVMPMRITESLVSILKRRKPLWCVVQFNHPREITAASAAALDLLVGSGIPVLDQTVLLRGVNDDPEVLAELFSSLVRSGVKPYYLFQGDLAPGTSHLRVPLRRGMEIAAELGRLVSGIERPVYAVDLPGGGGKIVLSPSMPPEERDGFFRFTSREGGSFTYPAEE